MFDLKIVNGMIIAGADGPPQPGCIAVKDGRIAAMDSDIPGAAGKTLDAGGMAVCPGFIDLHTHCSIGHNQNYLRAGVTTVVSGNCGFGRPPSDPQQAVSGNCGPNIAFLTGHNTLRMEVMGNVKRAPSPAELEHMTELAAQDMSAGAVGFSAGLTYVPGNYAETPELIHLARTAADFGGIYTVHMRDEGAGFSDSIAETARIAGEAGLPAHISHLKLYGSDVWGRSGEALEMLDQARSNGLDITWDQYPYTASNGRILLLFPQWSQEGTDDELKARLTTPETRAGIKSYLTDRIGRMYDGDGSRIVIATAPEPALAGQTLADVSSSFGHSASTQDVAETVIELLVRYPSQSSIYCVFHAMCEEDVQRVLSHPVTIVASDGWSIPFGEGHPHPRQYGTCPRVLGHYSRDKKLFSMAEAVKRMTAMPAKRLGLTDRGILAEGAWADIVIFDPDSIRDTATFENPHQYPDGISSVLVNGRVAVENGKETGHLPGKYISRPK